MEEDKKMTILTSSTSFIAEIMLILMGLSGISIVGVILGYFHSLSLLIINFGLSIGILAIIICIIGIYVLLYHDYLHLRLFLKFLALFIGLQLIFIIYLYVFINDNNISEQQQGSFIALDVCCGLSASALIALCFHLKQKGSTIDMFKL
ncbi:unnamed protein product [Rotaria sordida]|uniref:Uncharacterized protein n=1 Tax=Rotaria sordida TaxID=392033 RepID=A0A813VWK9_9BILA|nr:unnamed protein product [Rotaria sordida]CAF0843193.1 unnamed protein product [Rotaria sordida]CAF0852618.1 unnamed protein product [Rotaria sordida]CAF0853566.1 unnamed protein product [Rotaria sordida]CAF0945342.1 unnamed protein product [Rotaria sordida]